MSHRLPVCLKLMLLAFCLAQFGPNHVVYPQVAHKTSPAEKSNSAMNTGRATEARDYSEEAFVLEQLTVSYRYEKDGTGKRELTTRLRVQSEAGVQQFGQLRFAYSSTNEKLDIDFLRVTKPDGTVINGAAGDVQDLSTPVAMDAPVYTDVREKHITVRSLRPGDVLEYHLVWTLHTPLAQNNFWLEQNVAYPKSWIVLDEQVLVDIPQNTKVKLKTAVGFDPEIRNEAERRLYTWKYSNLKHEEKDEDSDQDKTERDDEPKPPQVQMTTFQTWEEVGRWYAGLERERIVPDDKIRAKTQELIQGLMTDKEKIEALYQFVSKNFRYVSLSLGEGRYQPHAAADVYANQYGDCKDKHTLLSAMLIAAGLRGYPALMNSSRKIDADLPSPGQFDHVITAVPLTGETLWMDTTAEVAPFRLIAPQLRDKKALLITDKTAALETTPAEPPFLSQGLVEISGQINELGRLSGHGHLVFRGDDEMGLRIIFRRTPKSEWKNLKYYFSVISGLQDGEITEIKPSDPAAVEKPFEVDYDFSSNEFLDWSSKKTKVTLPLPSLRLANVSNDKAQGTKPIPVGAPTDITYRLKLTVPNQYQTHLPLPLSVKRDYAEYSSSYKLEGNTLIVERKFRLRAHELPAARLEDYRAFVAATRADENQTLSIESNLAATPTIPTTVKVQELIEAAEAAAKNQNYPAVEQLLKRVIEKEPKHKLARRQLGWALFAEQKLDEAISVLNEQTTINPFDDYSYNLLGRIYWRQQKYSDAETAFRKQIEITPLDKYSHGNLGQMLVQWRKYKEAVPELEQATSLSPEDPDNYVSLGRAYLNLGESVKANEAFDQAVKLASGPAVWNDVAYFLALGKVQLDKAQQYAESAVTAVATDLRNAELQNLTIENLREVAVLASHWDTLGWVHFQKGELDTAERYLNAAWALDQHSEIAYHLGMIYEKRGKTEDAIHMYALSSAADRTVPEGRESLERLVGKDKVEAWWKKADAELRDSRTIRLAAPVTNVKGATEAQFYVVLTPGPSRAAQVSELRFISGDEKLKPLGAMLKGGRFSLVFPDETTTKVIRRGTFFCQPTGTECTFMMISPEYVTSVE